MGINPWPEISLLLISNETTLRWLLRKWASSVAPESPINLSFRTILDASLSAYSLVEIDIQILK